MRSLDKQASEAPARIRTWRERIGFGPGYELHAATDVERAMVAQIADLEKALQRASAPASAAGDTSQWVVLGGQRIGRSMLMELQQNAERYLWLRDKADGMAGVAAPMVASLDDAGRVIDYLDGDDLDVAIDAAKAMRPPRRAPNKKRVGEKR